MTKQQKSPRIVDPATETPSAAPTPAEPAKAPAEPASAPAGSVPPPRGSLPQRLFEAAKARLRGTRLERLAKRVADTAAKAPARAERELDAALDRIGLVRKSRTQPPAPAGAPAPKAA
ncbi:MAG: hypothetical protein IT383_16500 [Deltaproteobacteria bacterium]|nr:hypothetical protein [Deltaproteobacteria bacterium]